MRYPQSYSVVYSVSSWTLTHRYLLLFADANQACTLRPTAVSRHSWLEHICALSWAWFFPRFRMFWSSVSTPRTQRDATQFILPHVSHIHTSIRRAVQVEQDHTVLHTVLTDLLSFVYPVQGLEGPRPAMSARLCKHSYAHPSRLRTGAILLTTPVAGKRHIGLRLVSVNKTPSAYVREKAR